MALITFTVTLTSGTDSVIGAASTLALDKGIRQLIISNPAGNGTLSYGPAPGGTFTTTPATLAAGAATQSLGPFNGSAPARLKELFFKGTLSNVITCTLISH